MVTTRRGSHRSSGEQNAGAVQVPGPSQRGRGTSGRGRGRSAARSAAKALEANHLPHERPIVEDGAGITGPDAAAVLQERLQGERTGTEAQASGSTKADGKRETAEGVEAADLTALEEEVESSQSEEGAESEGAEELPSESSETDSEGDDGDIVGPNFMDQLASSLKAALQARSGGCEASPTVPQPVSSARKLGMTSDPVAIKWQSEAQQNPVSRPEATKRMAPGVGATKEKGLNNLLMAPPRVNSADRPTSETKRWFELPATKITDEVKHELRLLRLRGAYDPKRFYKSFDETKFPKHFQIGTVMDNAQDYYSSRLTSRERGASITQELLADQGLTAVRKKRFGKLQQESTRYQKVKKRKTDLVRAIPKPKRPKH